LEDRQGVEEVLEDVVRTVRRLGKLASEASTMEAATDLIQKVDAKLYLAFELKQAKKRIVNKAKGGVLTFVGAPPPIDVYCDPTSRGAIKKTAVTSCGGDCPSSDLSVSCPDEEDSLGNVSRAERI
jgi:hypothetical protein